MHMTISSSINVTFDIKEVGIIANITMIFKTIKYITPFKKKITNIKKSVKIY